MKKRGFNLPAQEEVEEGSEVSHLLSDWVLFLSGFAFFLFLLAMENSFAFAFVLSFVLLFSFPSFFSRLILTAIHLCICRKAYGVSFQFHPSISHFNCFFLRTFFDLSTARFKDIGNIGANRVFLFGPAGFAKDTSNFFKATTRDPKVVLGVCVCRFYDFR